MERVQGHIGGNLSASQTGEGNQDLTQRCLKTYRGERYPEDYIGRIAEGKVHRGVNGKPLAQGGGESKPQVVALFIRQDCYVRLSKGNPGHHGVGYRGVDFQAVIYGEGESVNGDVIHAQVQESFNSSIVPVRGGVPGVVASHNRPKGIILLRTAHLDFACNFRLGARLGSDHYQ